MSKTCFIEYFKILITSFSVCVLEDLTNGPSIVWLSAQKKRKKKYQINQLYGVYLSKILRRLEW